MQNPAALFLELFILHLNKETNLDAGEIPAKLLPALVQVSLGWNPESNRSRGRNPLRTKSKKVKFTTYKC